MPLDDLDDFLAMELGAPTQKPKTSQQVNSLEALVLSRVQQTCPPEDRPSPLETNKINAHIPETSENPLYELVDLILPIVNTLTLLLTNPELEVNKDLLANQRSQLAEKLLNLPEIQSIDKASIFAAVASCIDSVNSTKPEKRIAAQARLNSLSQSLISAKQEALQQQFQIVDEFLDYFPNQQM